MKAVAFAPTKPASSFGDTEFRWFMPSCHQMMKQENIDTIENCVNSCMENRKCGNDSEKVCHPRGLAGVVKELGAVIEG